MVTLGKVRLMVCAQLMQVWIGMSTSGWMTMQQIRCERGVGFGNYKLRIKLESSCGLATTIPSLCSPCSIIEVCLSLLYVLDALPSQKAHSIALGTVSFLSKSGESLAFIRTICLQTTTLLAGLKRELPATTHFFLCSNRVALESKKQPVYSQWNNRDPSTCEHIRSYKLLIQAADTTSCVSLSAARFVTWHLVNDREIVLNVDGSSSGNPGHYGSGGIIQIMQAGCLGFLVALGCQGYHNLLCYSDSTHRIDLVSIDLNKWHFYALLFIILRT